MKKWISDIFYSFPVQLVLLHLRNNLLLIFIWVLIVLLMTGAVGRLFGTHYLFLAPEYLGEVNFVSFFFLGLAFGGFYMSWNLTTYLLDAHHFPFLASLGRPFTKFCLNNSIIPLIFITLYLVNTIKFQRYFEYWDAGTILYNCLGFLFGLIVTVALSALYFRFTNKDVFNFTNKIAEKDPTKVLKNISPQRRNATIKKFLSGKATWKVNTYLTESLRPRLVRSVSHYEQVLLLRVFKQNHINALVVQLLGLVALVTLGLLIDYRLCRIPAGASVFILAAVLVAVTGAVTYWFDKWNVTVFVFILLTINYMTSYDIFNHKNKGYGLNYKDSLAQYDYESIAALSSPETIEIDKASTIKILDKWRSKFDYNPKMVISCASGGGLKAAVWTMQVLQETDSIMQGDLFKHSVLITGASGGLMGTAYLRELYLRKTMGESINVYDKKYIDNIAQDLLNSITFTIVSNDLFLPWAEFESGGHIYRKDRGYIFEKQLNENTGYVLDKKLSDYQQPEQEALIPMLFISPSIVNDGRRLMISPQGVSYMSIAPIGVKRKNTVEYDAVDFGRMFEQQGAYEMNFTSALRMNATYPYILPNIYLPSSPGIEVMDAGFRDNFGIMSATRFVHVFKDWILENTDGVVLMQMSGCDKIEEIIPSDNEGIVESVLNPLGIASQLMTLQDYEHDNHIGYMYDILGEDYFEIVRFIYHPSVESEPASMTFHLTSREKDDILKSYQSPENQESLHKLLRLMDHSVEQTLGEVNH